MGRVDAYVFAQLLLEWLHIDSAPLLKPLDRLGRNNDWLLPSLATERNSPGLDKMVQALVLYPAA